jgi:Ariadne domain
MIGNCTVVKQEVCYKLLSVTKVLRLIDILKFESQRLAGFFRCNRWVDQKDMVFEDDTIPIGAEDIGRALANEDINDPRTMEVTYGTSMFDTRTTKQKSKEMNRFLHHFQRWNAHSESAALERKMGDSVCERLALVVEEAIRLNGGDNAVFLGKGLSFVHAAFIELLECRSMLQHSYAMSYFRYKSVDSRRYRLMRRRANEKANFEQFQAELELMTEHISDIVARSHLRASMMQIMFLTNAASEKRKEFSNVMINILFEETQEKERPQEHDSSQPMNSTHSTLPGYSLDIISGFNSLALTNSSQNELNNVENAVRRSLYQFLARSGTNPLLSFDDDDSESGSDWACTVCTYVNSGGRHCAMCRNHRL